MHILRTVPVCYTCTPAARWGRHTASGRVEVSRIIKKNHYYVFPQTGNTTAHSAQLSPGECVLIVCFSKRNRRGVEGEMSLWLWALGVRDKAWEEARSVSQQSLIQFNINVQVQLSPSRVSDHWPGEDQAASILTFFFLSKLAVKRVSETLSF